MSPPGCQKMSAKPCNRNAEENFPVLSLKSREQKPPNSLLIQDKNVLQPTWQPPSSPGRESAAVLQPHRFCRTTRQWIMRTPKDKGGYQYAVLVTTVPDLEPTALADAYDGRAMIEATFCHDKQALGLVTRWQRRWEAQQMVLLVARLAHHL